MAKVARLTKRSVETREMDFGLPDRPTTPNTAMYEEDHKIDLHSSLAKRYSNGSIYELKYHSFFYYVR